MEKYYLLLIRDASPKPGFNIYKDSDVCILKAESKIEFFPDGELFKTDSPFFTFLIGGKSYFTKEISKELAMEFCKRRKESKKSKIGHREVESKLEETINKIIRE